MAKKSTAKSGSLSKLLTLRQPETQVRTTQSCVHVYGDEKKLKVRCDTDSRGHAVPGNADPTRLVLDASNGTVPLWQPGVTLRWRFKQASLEAFNSPAAVATRVEELMTAALMAWGDAVPVKFTKDEDDFDFQIVVRSSDDCDPTGCVLASAFFPDAGRHEFVIYPKMFSQSNQEQVETMCHEFGHVFGLRHFFAQITETGYPSVLFGAQSKFTIMNYGVNSALTEKDKTDLIKLYDEVWNGGRTDINGTPIMLWKPYTASEALLSFAPAAETMRNNAMAAAQPTLPTPHTRMPRPCRYAQPS